MVSIFDFMLNFIVMVFFFSIICAEDAMTMIAEEHFFLNQNSLLCVKEAQSVVSHSPENL